MADGQAFLVPQPDYLTMSPSGRTVVIDDENENRSILDLLLLTVIETTVARRAHP
jgi:hypothetical protein